MPAANYYYSLNYYGGTANVQLGTFDGPNVFVSASANYGVTNPTQTTSLQLIGRNYSNTKVTGSGPYQISGYGQSINQNFLSLLENFANTATGLANTAVYPNFIRGQLIYRVDDSQLLIAKATGDYTTLSGASNLIEISTSENPANIIKNGNSNVYVNANGNVTISSAGNANILVITGTGANVSGTLTITDNTTAPEFIGNLTGNISATTGQFTGNVSVGNNLSVTSNITSGNANLGNLATANYFSGVLTTAAQPNITLVGTLSALTVSGDVNVGDKVNANGVTSNGSIQINNATDATWNFIGNAAGLTSVPGANIVGTITGATVNTANFANFAGNITVGAQPNITSVGSLTGLTVAGNITAGNIENGGNIVVANYLGGVIVAASSNQPNITSMGNVTFTGNIVVQGTITGVISGNSSTTITGGNATFANLEVTTTANLAGGLDTTTIDMTGDINMSSGNISTSGNLSVSNISASSITGSGTLSITGNISGGNINTSGVVSATGNITGGNITSNSRVTANHIVTSSYILAGGNLAVNGGTIYSDEATFNLFPANVTTLNIGAAATTVEIGSSSGTTTVNNNLQVDLGATITGNLSAGNISTSGVMTATGTITGGNFSTAGTVTATGTVTGGNLSTAGILSVTGNANVGNLGTSGLIVATGNVTGGNLVTSGVVSATGTITGGNISTAGTVTATGNVTGGNLVTTGTGDIGTLKTTAITTGASGTGGTITGNWTLSSGSKLQSTYADLAEYYTSELNITPGTVVEFGGTQEIQMCDTRNSTRVAGIVSTDPAYIMNEKTGQSVPRILVALVGRVPCKVYGTCAKGDLMVAAGGGYAMANNSPVIGSVVGKALEDKITTGVGIIEVAVGRL